MDDNKTTNPKAAGEPTGVVNRNVETVMSGKKTTVIALLDKEYPPSESFVDGMLAKVVRRQAGISVWFVVSRGVDRSVKPRSYLRTWCWPILFKRRGLRRFLNLYTGIRACKILIKRAVTSSDRVVLFARNDPILLLSCVINRHKVDGLIFQSTFPHEKGSFKGIVARLLYGFSQDKVDAVTAVSPMGLMRTHRLFPKARTAEVIPMLVDQPPHMWTSNLEKKKYTGNPVRFIYVGTHVHQRKLEFVLKGIVRALDSKTDATFTFVGGSIREIKKLMEVRGVDELIRRQRLRFVEKTPRSDVPKFLENSDVGISLIPPTETYKEASPTKVAEYMGAGLAVLANRDIELQEKFVSESRCGILVDWSVEAIADGIRKLSVGSRKLEEMKRNARDYAVSHLQYSSYIPVFLKLIGHN